MAICYVTKDGEKKVFTVKKTRLPRYKCALFKGNSTDEMIKEFDSLGDCAVYLGYKYGALGGYFRKNGVDTDTVYLPTKDVTIRKFIES